MIGIPPPWTATLTPPEYLLTVYFLGITALAMIAGVIRAALTSREVGTRYRSATAARLAVSAIAAISYGAIFVLFLTSYTATPAGYLPNSQTILTMALRYMEWSVTVPLLVVELLAVCTLVGPKTRLVRATAATSGFLMIFTGFLGVFGAGSAKEDPSLEVLFIGLSCLFLAITMLILGRVVCVSRTGLPRESGALLTRGGVTLLSGWILYPVVFSVQIFAAGGQWTTIIQIAFCVVDLTVKIGLGGVIHRIAKLRTAEDVRLGFDIHPESIWISSVKQSDAGLAREVYLEQTSIVHTQRPKPPTTEAFADTPTPGQSAADSAAKSAAASQHDSLDYY